MDKTYKHDIESYVITIRRKGPVSSAVQVEEALKPAQPVHKIERPVHRPSVAPAPVPEAAAVASPVGVPSDGAHAPGDKAIKSPLPGVIVAVKVNVGDVVKTGQVVAVLEAMKMENEIQSEYDGTVASVDVSQGDSVLEGALIVSLSS